jgi:hypothetical protein
MENEASETLMLPWETKDSYSSPSFPLKKGTLRSYYSDTQSHTCDKNNNDVQFSRSRELLLFPASLVVV